MNDRMLSGVLGGTLVAIALRRIIPTRLLFMAGGAFLLQRALSGRCAACEALGRACPP